MDYLSFYELKLEPFSNAPVTRFYYNSKQHSLAMTKLMYAIKNMRGLAVVEGDIGTGKTTLARRLLESLPEDEYVATLLVMVHSEITAQWLLKRINAQLGVEKPMGNKLHLLSQLYRRLVEIYKEGKKAVVLIDEAQMLRSREIMEEFRGMLNLEVPERKLITFVLFGLPELSEHLKIDEPLRQRVALRIRLKPLDLEGTGHYIIHRLRVAGAKKMFFTVEAIKAIYHFTGGNPRLINTVCDNALLEGYLRKQPIIDRKLIHTVARELGLPIAQRTQQPQPQQTRQRTITEGWTSQTQQPQSTATVATQQPPNATTQPFGKQSEQQTSTQPQYSTTSQSPSDTAGFDESTPTNPNAQTQPQLSSPEHSAAQTQHGLPPAPESEPKEEPTTEPLFSGNIPITSPYIDAKARKQLIEEMDRKLGIASAKKKKEEPPEKSEDSSAAKPEQQE